MSKVISINARLDARRRIDCAGERAAAVMSRLREPAPRVPVFMRSVPSLSVTPSPALVARIEAVVLTGREHWRSTPDVPRTRGYEAGGRLAAMQRLIGGRDA